MEIQRCFFTGFLPDRLWKTSAVVFNDFTRTWLLFSFRCRGFSVRLSSVPISPGFGPIILIIQHVDWCMHFLWLKGRSLHECSAHTYSWNPRWWSCHNMAPEKVGKTFSLCEHCASRVQNQNLILILKPDDIPMLIHTGNLSCGSYTVHQTPQHASYQPSELSSIGNEAAALNCVPDHLQSWIEGQWLGFTSRKNIGLTLPRCAERYPLTVAINEGHCVHRHVTIFECLVPTTLHND